MNDLISRQAAIDGKILITRNNGLEIYSDEAVPVAYLQSLPPAQSEQECEKCIFRPFKQFQPEPQWIPCSERLPKEKRQQYWICTDTGYQCQCRWTDNVYGFGPSNNWGWKIFDIPQYQKVVAWMPLPEPYKEEQP